ncbi:MAG: formate dehydrogenase subunit delta [Planctomycetes bacterium]|nr:formate dehydrogenase subunit delta [Planctomycetota bacterium]
MNRKKLVTMANQIAAFFAAEPDHSVAVAGVAGHLQRYWEPRMRREVYAVLDGGGEHGLSPLVVEALVAHRASLEPARP